MADKFKRTGPKMKGYGNKVERLGDMNSFLTPIV
jgi:hypothetical protein